MHNRAAVAQDAAAVAADAPNAPNAPNAAAAVAAAANAASVASLAAAAVLEHGSLQSEWRVRLHEQLRQNVREQDRLLRE